MLIIGQVANSYHLGKWDNETSPNEFLCWNENEINLVKKELKLTQKDQCFTNKVSTVYKKNGRMFTIHNSENLPILNSLRRFIPAIEGKFKMAPATLVAAWTKAKSTFLHKDLDEWHQSILTYSHLYPQIVPLRVKWAKRIKIWSTHLCFIGAMSYGNDYMPHDYKDYDDLPEDALFDLFQTETGISYWKKLTNTQYSKGHPNLTVFTKMNQEERIGAVLERLYVDCANEFLIDEFVYDEVMEETTLDLFKRNIMYRCSQTNYPWLIDFIIENYIEILDKFDPYFPDILADAIKYKMIKSD